MRVVDENEVREDFEDAVFLKYFTSGVHLNPNPNPRAMGTDRLIPAQDLMMKSEFCARDEEGDYKQNGLNPAWWAWKKAHEKYSKGT